MAHALANEHLVAAGVEGHMAQALGHTVGAHHLSGNGGGPLQVVGGAGGDISQHQLLGGPAAQEGHDLVLHVSLGQVRAVLLRQADGHAAGLSPGNDGDLMHRVLARQIVHHYGVAGLMEGCELTLLLRDDPAVLFRAGNNLDDGFLNGFLPDHRFIPPPRQQRRLIEQVLQIRAGKACGTPGNFRQVHILRQRLVSGVDLQDLLPALDIRQPHIYLPVKPAGAQQRRIQDVHPVGGGQHHHARVGGKSVHFHQELVEGLLPLVVSAAQSAAALTAHGVDLVDKYNGGGLFFRLLKQVTDAAGAHAHIHFHKVGAGDG